jgi:hypothetical protein
MRGIRPLVLPKRYLSTKPGHLPGQMICSRHRVRRTGGRGRISRDGIENLGRGRACPLFRGALALEPKA